MHKTYMHSGLKFAATHIHRIDKDVGFWVLLLGTIPGEHEFYDVANSLLKTCARLHDVVSRTLGFQVNRQHVKIYRMEMNDLPGT